MATYAFDPTGISSANKIPEEIQTIAPTALRDYQFIIPANAPFFKDGFTMTYIDVNGVSKVMQPGVDFYFTHKFMDASKACAKAIYGSITFVDKNIKGSLKYGYQTLGGGWVLDSATILQLLATVLTNPARTSWEQIVALPYSFPVIDHDWQTISMVGMDAVVDSILQVAQAINNNQTLSNRVTKAESDIQGLITRVTILENK